MQNENTQTPTRLRIFRDVQRIEDGNPWTLDGIDDNNEICDQQTGRIYPAYTEQCWTFPTFSAAVAAMPEFAARLQSNVGEPDE